jgi:hypothetical protein
MTLITYEIVEHDGGWAYRVDGVVSETLEDRSFFMPSSSRRTPLQQGSRSPWNIVRMSKADHDG